MNISQYYEAQSTDYLRRGSPTIMSPQFCKLHRTCPIRHLVLCRWEKNFELVKLGSKVLKFFWKRHFKKQKINRGSLKIGNFLPFTDFEKLTVDNLLERPKNNPRMLLPPIE